MSLQRFIQLATTLVIVVAATTVSLVSPAAVAHAAPRAAQQPAAQISQASAHLPSREVFGFGLASSLADPTIGYPSWNFSLLSTVAFFGLHINGDGTIVSDSGLNVWNSTTLTNLL